MAQDWPKHPVLVDCLVVSRGKLSGRTKAKFEVLPMAWSMLQNYQATSVNAEGLQIGIQNPSVFSARCTFWKLSQSVPLERGALNQAAMSRNDKVACMKRYEQISKKHGCCEVWVSKWFKPTLVQRVLKGNTPTCCHVGSAQAKLLLKPKCQRLRPLQPSGTQGTFRLQWDILGPYPTCKKTAAAALSQSLSSTLAWH